MDKPIERYPERMDLVAPRGFTELVDRPAVINGTSRSEIVRQSVRALAQVQGISIQLEREKVPALSTEAGPTMKALTRCDITKVEAGQDDLPKA